MKTNTFERKEFKELAKAYIAYKAAEKRFNELKETIKQQLDPGKYIFKEGEVIKSIVTRQTLDSNKLFKENPELKREDYIKESTIEVLNLRLN